MKKLLIGLGIAVVFIVICLVLYNVLFPSPPKMHGITSIHVEYSDYIANDLSLESPMLITDPDDIAALVGYFNKATEYVLGCKCPANDIKMIFKSKHKEYQYSIGISGDPRIRHDDIKQDESDLLEVDIDDILDVLNKYTEVGLLYWPFRGHLEYDLYKLR